MKLEIINSNVGDNFFCLVADEDGQAVVFDPIDGEQAVERAQRLDVEITHIVCTHFHPDHVGGNPTVLQAFPEAVVVASEEDRPKIDQQFEPKGQRGVDEIVRGGDTLHVGDLDFQVLDTPGHTPGHISLHLGHHLFSGDTIFVGGAGNCRFGGDPGVLFQTFRDVLRELPPETVFYPGHDYAVRNAEFLLSLEPEQEETKAVLQEAKQAAAEGRLMKTTLGREQAYNAFLRYDDPALKERLASMHGELLDKERQRSQSEDEAVFRCVRSLRNDW